MLVSLLACNPNTPSNNTLDAGLADVSLSVIDAGQDNQIIDAGIDAPPLCPPDMVLVSPQSPYTVNTTATFPLDPGDFNFDAGTVNYKFCVDRYEYPNQEGVKPISGQTSTYFANACQVLGKRLLTHAEWTIACQGENHYFYGYGNTYQHGRCNDAKQWINPNWSLMDNDAAWAQEVARLYQGVANEPSDCYSEWNGDKIYNMVANTGEVAVDPKSQYGTVELGCFWSMCYRNEAPHCGYSNYAHPFNLFRTYEMSARCAKDITQ
jgi:hypothetical protein